MCSIAGGDPPDLIWFDRFAVGEWAARDAFLPLDDLIRQIAENQEQAQQIRDAIASVRPGDAAATLHALAASLEPLGPTRQIELANYIAEHLSDESDKGELIAKAKELTDLCQGIRAEKFYKGALSVEFEGIEDSLLGLEIGLENLRKYVAQ